MVLQYTPDGHMLYVQFRDDDVAETVEVEIDVYLDLDAEGRPVGVEFVNADDFFPFLGRGLEEIHSVVEVPRSLEARLERLLGARGVPVDVAAPTVEPDVPSGDSRIGAAAPA